MASATKSSSISTALETANTKKENLQKAFEALQSQSSLLSSFTLQWKDLEDHYDSIRKTIEDRLKQLESKEKPQSEPEPEPTKRNSRKTMDDRVKELESKRKPEPAKMNMECVNHPEMKTICAKMDGMGLRNYIMKHRKELTSIRDEVSVALRAASDPAKMVLDAMQGFYQANSKGEKDGEVAGTRRTCILLLEELFNVEESVGISLQVKERAKKLAMEWKGKVSTGGENPLEYLALLQLIATYGLTGAFSGDELFDLAVVIVRRKQAIDLIKALGLGDKVSDFIPKLTESGKHLDAVKFVYAFELVDKFPPVPLLKAYQKQSKKVAQDIRNKGNHSVQSLNEAIAKELAALRAIIKIIEENNLESEFPTKDLDKRIEQLEKQKADKKRPAAAARQQQQSGNKRPRSAASNAVASTVPSISQSRLQPASSLVDRAIPYMSSSAQHALLGIAPSGPSYMNSAAGSHGLGANPTARSYGLGANPSAGSYGLGANPLGYGATGSPPRSYLYSFESNMESNGIPGLYDRSMGFGGPGMPPSYRSPYYP